MNQCKQCGATLPQDSRFCLQCGTENLPGNSLLPEKELDFLKPSAIGGFALGVLSALPFISAINIICCLWAQAGGGLTVWLLNKQRPGGVKYSDGALGGVLAGLIGAIIATIISIPIQMLVFTEEFVAQTKTQLEQLQLPPAVMESISNFMAPGFNLSRALIGLLFNMLLLGLFAMIGGILMVAVANNQRTRRNVIRP